MTSGRVARRLNHLINLQFETEGAGGWGGEINQFRFKLGLELLWVTQGLEIVCGESRFCGQLRLGAQCLLVS